MASIKQFQRRECSPALYGEVTALEKHLMDALNRPRPGLPRRQVSIEKARRIAARCKLPPPHNIPCDNKLPKRESQHIPLSASQESAMEELYEGFSADCGHSKDDSKFREGVLRKFVLPCLEGHPDFS